MSRFRDTTGRPGPRTWELGSYPDGRADYPVGGLSWFEAAAFAKFAGKSLPHCTTGSARRGPTRSTPTFFSSATLTGRGRRRPANARSGAWGTLDMAGNVKEWCATKFRGAVCGTSWAERGTNQLPVCRRGRPEPWERRETFGVRLVKNLGPAEPAAVPVGRVMPDPARLSPCPPSCSRFTSAPTTTTAVRSTRGWSRSTRVRLLAKGENQLRRRVWQPARAAYLFLPKNAAPPIRRLCSFQAPTGGKCRRAPASNLNTFEFIIRSGRALLYPVYQGTYERRGNVQAGPSGLMIAGLSEEISWEPVHIWLRFREGTPPRPPGSRHERHA